MWVGFCLQSHNANITVTPTKAVDLHLMAKQNQISCGSVDLSGSTGQTHSWTDSSILAYGNYNSLKDNVCVCAVWTSVLSDLAGFVPIWSRNYAKKCIGEYSFFFFLSPATDCFWCWSDVYEPVVGEILFNYLFEGVTLLTLTPTHGNFQNQKHQSNRVRNGEIVYLSALLMVSHNH